MKNTKKALSKKEFAKTINAEKTSQLLKHFNEIYECEELGQHEINIAYLAYLWKSGVFDSNSGNDFLEDPENDFDIMDYELQFEVAEELQGGINLEVTYEFYKLENLMKLV